MEVHSPVLEKRFGETMASTYERKLMSQNLEAALAHERRVARLEFFVSFLFLASALFLIFTEDIRSFLLSKGAWPAFLDSLLLPDEVGTIPPDTGVGGGGQTDGGTKSGEEEEVSGLTVKESLLYLLGGLAAAMALGALASFLYRTYGIARVIKKQAPDWEDLRNAGKISGLSDKRRYDNVLAAIGSIAVMERTGQGSTRFSRVFDKEGREFVASVRTALSHGYKPPDGSDNWSASLEKTVDYFLQEFRRKHPTLPIPQSVYQDVRRLFRLQDLVDGLTLDSTEEDIERLFGLSRLSGEDRELVERMLLPALVDMPWRAEKGWSLDDLKEKARSWGISEGLVDKIEKRVADTMYGIHFSILRKTSRLDKDLSFLAFLGVKEDELAALRDEVQRLKTIAEGGHARKADKLLAEKRYEAEDEKLGLLETEVADMRKRAEEVRKKRTELEEEAKQLVKEDMAYLAARTKPAAQRTEADLPDLPADVRAMWDKIEQQIVTGDAAKEAYEEALADMSREQRRAEAEKSEAVASVPLAPNDPIILSRQ